MGLDPRALPASKVECVKKETLMHVVMSEFQETVDLCNSEALHNKFER